jgi:hypothetical protein
MDGMILNTPNKFRLPAAVPGGNFIRYVDDEAEIGVNTLKEDGAVRYAYRV